MLVPHYSLLKCNSFGINIYASHYTCLTNTDQLGEIMDETRYLGVDHLILGEGTNVLFLKDYDGVIIHNCLKGIETAGEDENSVFIRAYAGENWDKFVEIMVKRGYGGLENLSYIPGSVGASPVQNIGAYGVEVKDRIHRVEGYTLPELNFRILSNKDCLFGYRKSIFRRELKSHFLITAVVFRLDKHPVFHLDYAGIEQVFTQKPVQTLKTLRETIIEVRKSKLPEIQEYGNAGSFFKNPLVTGNKYNKLKEFWDDIPGYSDGEGKVKIPAAWLIEKAGWKGKREGDTGIWPKQPLVLVNYGSATGREIFIFSEKIRSSVYKQFGIKLSREVNIC